MSVLVAIFLSMHFHNIKKTYIWVTDWPFFQFVWKKCGLYEALLPFGLLWLFQAAVIRVTHHNPAVAVMWKRNPMCDHMNLSSLTQAFLLNSSVVFLVVLCFSALCLCPSTAYAVEKMNSYQLASDANRGASRSAFMLISLLGYLWPAWTQANPPLYFEMLSAHNVWASWKLYCVRFNFRAIIYCCLCQECVVLAHVLATHHKFSGILKLFRF